MPQRSLTGPYRAAIALAVATTTSTLALPAAAQNPGQLLTLGMRAPEPNPGEGSDSQAKTDPPRSPGSAASVPAPKTEPTASPSASTSQPAGPSTSQPAGPSTSQPDGPSTTQPTGPSTASSASPKQATEPPSQPTEGSGTSDATAPDIAVDQGDRPRGGGVGGAVVEGTEEDAQRQAGQLEGDTLGTRSEGTKLEPLQAAGWWSMFGAVAVATAGGVFIGMMANEEDKALRLRTKIDPTTGRYPTYGSIESEYDEIYERGATYQKTAHALLIAGGATAIVAAILLSVHAGRRGKASRVAALANGMELKF